MHATLRSYFTTGVALAGAGAIALAPLVVPPPALSPLEKAAAQSVMQHTNLLAATGDLGGSFNASLDGLLAGLATALNLDVTVDGNGGVSLPDFIAALTDRFTGGLSGGGTVGGGMGGGLGDLLRIPIELLTTAFGNLLGQLPGTGTGGGGGLPNLGGPLGAGLTTLAAFLNNAITTGAAFLADAVTASGPVLINAAAALAATAARFETIPVIGATITVIAETLGRLAAGGVSTINDIAAGITRGAEALTTLISNAVGVITGGPNPTMAVAATTGPAASMLAAVKAGSAPSVPGSLRTATTPAPAAGGSVDVDGHAGGSTKSNLPDSAGVNAQAATSGSGTVSLPDNASQTAKDVRGTLNTSTDTGVNLGKAISGIASGKTDVTGGGSATGGGAASGGGSASGNASATGQAASAAGGANGAAHANAHASGHHHLHAGK